VNKASFEGGPYDDPASREQRWLNTALEEYRSIRAESMAALQSHLATLRYGLAGIVVLIGLALREHKEPLGWGIALTIVPILVLFVAIMWMGEYERMARAGRYLADFEARINGPFDDRGEEAPMKWENWLRNKGPEKSHQAGARHRYFFIYLIFFVMEILTLVIGWHSLLEYLDKTVWHAHVHSRPNEENRWLIPFFVSVNVAMAVIVAAYFRSSFERLREYATAPGELDRPVRRRLRVRAWLWISLLLVALASLPWPVWAVWICAVVWHIPNFLLYGSTGFAFLWIVGIPLMAPESIVRPLLEKFVMRTRELTPGEQDTIKEALDAKADPGEDKASVESYLDKDVTGGEFTLTMRDDEIAHIEVVDAIEPNASAVAREGVTVTCWACLDTDRCRPLLTHEIAHHRLKHLRVLALMHLYLWPYLYCANKRQLPKVVWRGPRQKKLREALLPIVWTFGFTGWCTLRVLRVTGRVVEHDADRYVCNCGLGDQLLEVLSGAPPPVGPSIMAWIACAIRASKPGEAYKVDQPSAGT
jgi:hypothetical protein